MAGLELTLDMGGDDLLPAWRTVIDVAGTGISRSLTLVGGLMVAAHGIRAGVVMRRYTDDMDALVDYWADRTSLTATRVALAKIGFELVESEEHAYRFVHADDRKSVRSSPRGRPTSWTTATATGTSMTPPFSLPVSRTRPSSPMTR